MSDLANQVGQNKIAVRICVDADIGYLVMFMQLGFALLETGLARAKNANHTMMMNMGVYGIGMFAYWLIGFAIQMGGAGAVANFALVLRYRFRERLGVVRVAHGHVAAGS